jgi:putative SOS response-associated peptidase YedK
MVLFRLARFTDLFPWIRSIEAPPRFNIAPQTPVVTIPNDGRFQMQAMRWGLVPSWAADDSVGARMINARLETAAEKPAFRSALKRRRCIIPADGFYEWKKTGDAKTPMYIARSDDRPMGFAGLWESWTSPDGSTLLSTTVLTTTPNALMAEIHDRMPVILDEAHWKAWLEPGERSVEQLASVLSPFPAELMRAFPVSTRVNSPRNDDATLIDRALPQGLFD